MFIINLVKKLFVSVSGLFTYLSLPLVAFAATVDPCKGPNNTDLPAGIAKTLCGLGGGNIGQTIRNVVVFFIIIAVVIALMYLLYGGVKWITSKGEKTEVEAARNHIMAAIIGLIVVFLAVFLLSIVLSAFGINWSDLQIPNISTATPET
ncbi:MAG: hypothetical protein US43_C0035G0003 [Candidatus Levybacteria bacterium GW2011_GWA1_37_16]|nr:MAG: hypothetical protein US43_C0035G0003 [Candidatus Levybacteria bacterium GW2011_GWA1_37_16]KKQ37031.1 MAG: hypothetical protein US55_C0044G0007 [Candidatus Levybacteria bacterium GW2011_GWC2_37_7]KKQ41203.1 MAG: hypothetical protein US59_C0038G0002 [Candidatus Levybacteria bacterium GW2011_GWB1_37_8]